MQFIFNGTVDALKDAIASKASELQRDIVVYHDRPDTLQIGFQRLGHSGGRFFVAKLTEENNTLVLDGEIQNLSTPMPDRDTRSVFRKIRDAVFALAIFYVFLGLVPCLLWFVCGLPHIWIPLALPAAFLLYLEIRALPGRKHRTFDAEDRSFLRFMAMVISGENTVPANSRQLYDMLLNTPGLHSLPQIQGDRITWDLYRDVYVEASVSECDTIINIVSRNILRGSCMHWHPDPEEMYDELLSLGNKGNILVLRKIFGGMEAYYYGEPGKYPFSPGKKWHRGKLIYLEQK